LQLDELQRLQVELVVLLIAILPILVIGFGKLIGARRLFCASDAPRRRQWLLWPLVFLYFVHPFITVDLAKVVRTCKTVDGIPYMWSDMQIRCDSQRYLVWNGVSIFLLLVWVIVGPALLLLYMYRHQKKRRLLRHMDRLALAKKGVMLPMLSPPSLDTVSETSAFITPAGIDAVGAFSMTTPLLAQGPYTQAYTGEDVKEGDRRWPVRAAGPATLELPTLSTFNGGSGGGGTASDDINGQNGYHDHAENANTQAVRADQASAGRANSVSQLSTASGATPPHPIQQQALTPPSQAMRPKVSVSEIGTDAGTPGGLTDGISLLGRDDIAELSVMPGGGARLVDRFDRADPLFFLRNGYVDSAWFWEFLVFLRKFSLIILIVIAADRPPTQTVWGSVVLLGAMVLHLLFRPLENTFHLHVELTSLLLSLATLQLSTFYYRRLANEVAVVVTAMLITTNLIFFVVVLIVTLRRSGLRCTTLSRSSKRQGHSAWPLCCINLRDRFHMSRQTSRAWQMAGVRDDDEEEHPMTKLSKPIDAPASSGASSPSSSPELNGTRQGNGHGVKSRDLGYSSTCARIGAALCQCVRWPFVTVADCWRAHGPAAHRPQDPAQWNNAFAPYVAMNDEPAGAAAVSSIRSGGYGAVVAPALNGHVHDDML